MKTLWITQIFVLLIVSIMGLWTMRMDDDGNMSDCPFDGGTAICQMPLFEHISQFQGVFSAIPSKTSLLMAFVLLSLMLVLSLEKLLPQLYITPYFYRKEKPG